MTGLEFLRRVLPSEGMYVGFSLLPPGSKPQVRQHFYDTIEDLHDGLMRSDNAGNNAYMATASFVTREGGRRQKNVHRVRSFFFDIDCGPGKPFDNWKDGLKALADFIKEHKLPKPTIVHSGNGLHVWWPLDKDITRDDWEPVAKGLKQLVPVVEQDITNPDTGEVETKKVPVFDSVVVADSARVLRMIGTTNKKGGRPVRLLFEGPITSLDEMRRCVPSVVVSKNAKQRTSKIMEDFYENQIEYPPANPDVIVAKCAQVKWAVENQNAVSEPVWYDLLGIAMVCKDPEKTALQWSHLHDDYDEDATLRKLEQRKQTGYGPTTCSRFEEHNPKGCKGCPFHGKMGSPAKLGLQYETKAPEETDDAPVDTILPPPWPFRRTTQGIVREEEGTDVVVLPYDIYPVGYGRDEHFGYEVVRFKWKRPHAGWQDLMFRQAYLAMNTGEFATALADQGIVLNGKSHAETVQYMLRSYMDELRKQAAMTNLYSSMGWKEKDDKFLLGEQLFSKVNNSVRRDTVIGSSAVRHSMSGLYETKGAAKSWLKYTTVLAKAKLYTHQFAMLVSMSAPLYKMSGIDGVVLNLYGKTGTGKTLAQIGMQSVWGNPKELHTSAKSTLNALYHRMALFGNLPFTIDEATLFDPKQIANMLYASTQGRDNRRLQRDGSEKAPLAWSLPVCTSSNKPYAPLLVTGGFENEAQLMRLLEIQVDPSPIFSDSTSFGAQIHNLLMSNYGHAGEVLIERYVDMGPGVIADMIKERREQLPVRYNTKFLGHERFWELTFVAADIAGEIATDLGLIDFDYVAAIRAEISKLGLVRKQYEEQNVSSFDVISEYLNEHAGMSVVITHTGTTTGKGTYDSSKTYPHGIRIRFELYRATTTSRPDRGVVFIHLNHFKGWCATKGADFRAIRRDIASIGADVTPSSGKAYLGKGTSVKTGQERVLGINLANDQFESILTDIDDAVDESNLNRLKVVN